MNNLLGGVGSLVAQRWRSHLPVQETWVRSLGQEDPLEEEMATHSRILPWETTRTEKPGGRQSTGSQRVRHNGTPDMHTSTWGEVQWASHFIRITLRSLVRVCRSLKTNSRWRLSAGSLLGSSFWINKSWGMGKEARLRKVRERGRGRLNFQFSSVQLVTQSCPTLCDPMDCSTPGLPVHHQLPEFTQTHVHWVGDAIQSSHPLSTPSPPTFNLSRYQGLFNWVSSSHQVAKILEFQLQHQSFQWTPRTDLL